MGNDHGTVYAPDVVPASDRRYVEESRRYGNRVGWGDSPAVLVVDMTVPFVEGRRTGGDPVGATAGLLETARDAGVPVVYAVPNDASYPDGYPVTTKASPASERGPDLPPTDEREAFVEALDTVVTAVAPLDDDPVVGKPRASAFFDTHLGNLLHHYDVDTLVVAGTNTSGCIRATVVDSHSSNFRTIVPPECVADTTTVAHEVSLFAMDARYADVTPVAEVRERLETYG